MTTKITADQSGCWLGGHHGYANHYHVIEIAQAHGFALDADDERLVEVYRISSGGSDIDAIVAYLKDAVGIDAHVAALVAEAESLAEDAAEAMLGQGGLVDKATEHLDSLAPEGMAFIWDMGELSLLCLCQIEGTEENLAVLESDTYHCDKEWH